MSGCHCGIHLADPAHCCPLCRRSSRPALTPRQVEVARLVRQGYSNKEIAYVLHLEYTTVKEYMVRIFRRLGVRNRAQLAALPHETSVEEIAPAA